MLNKPSLMLLALSLGLLLSGCATPPDGPVCVEMSPTSGHCFHTIKNIEQDVDATNLLDGKTWEQVNETGLIIPASYWGQLKAYLLKQCKKNNDCNDGLGKWQAQADKIDAGLQPKEKR